VNAVGVVGEGSQSTAVSATPQVPAPAAPAGLGATAANDQVTLTWGAVNGATSYDIYRSTSPGGEGRTPIRTGLVGTSFTDVGLTNGVTYYYQLTAVNAGGQSGHSFEVQATPYPPIVVGTGTGLTGQYYQDVNLGSLVLTRVDPTVAFTWPNETAPAAGMPNDYWSVKWTGQVQAQYNETYTFSTVSDDGVRLYINSQLVINDWTYHGAAQDSSVGIALQAGQKYTVEMDYFEGGGAATAQLLWSSPSTPLEIIPQSQLYTASLPVNLASAFNRAGIVRDGTTFSGGGLDGDGAALSANLLGSSLSWNGQLFNLGAANANDVIQARGQTINLPAGNFSSLTFLADAVNGNQPSLTFTVN
jgi:PA14 domain